MCGIFGMVGKGNVLPQTIDGLKKLEYRGYDSSGIAFLENQKLTVLKQVGEIAQLETLLQNTTHTASVAISHTRWATHGEPNTTNAHPHVSQNQQFALVHNGIIENYLPLKQTLSGVPFVSQTDTEVAVQLLEKNFHGNVLQALQQTCNQQTGSYAFAVVFQGEPNTLYVAKNNSPLVVAHTGTLGLISSDPSAILPYTQNQFMLNNGEFAKITDNNVWFYDNNLNEIKKETFVVGKQENEITKAHYPHFMLKEIHEIPTVVKNILNQYQTEQEVYACIPKEVCKKVQHISIVACGTAYHAGLIGKNILEKWCNIPTTVEIASEFRYKEKHRFYKNTLTIFVSQSGETADTLAAQKLCKQLGQRTLGIVNVQNSSLVYSCDHVLFTYAGREIGVASTKVYNAQMVVFYLLASVLALSKNTKKAMPYQRVKQEIANLFTPDDWFYQTEAQSRKLARQLLGASSMYVIGRQQDVLTAHEASLKMKEISYIHSESYPAGELKHGTISLIEQGTPVIAFFTQERVMEKTLNAVHEVISRGAKVIAITTLNHAFGSVVNQVISLPTVNEVFAPLVSIIPIQFLAYYTSVQLGNNPDKPRNLAKSVTVE